MNVSSKPSVLVGITTRNRASYLSKAIESARAQDYPAVRIAVVDDASTDGTPALRENYPAVGWIRHDSMRGYMANRNNLMGRSEFDYFVSLDDDAWFLRGDEISLAVARMEADPAIAGVAFDILSPDRPDAIPRTPPRRTHLFIGCGHILRLRAVREAGYYAPVPGAYGGEEKDLALRLTDLGYCIEMLPGVHVWHEKAWSDRDNNPLHRSGVCNEMVITLRRCPLPEVAWILPLKVVNFARFWMRQPSYTVAGVRGLADFCRHFGENWRKRQPVKRATYWRFKRGQS